MSAALPGHKSPLAQSRPDMPRILGGKGMGTWNLSELSLGDMPMSKPHRNTKGQALSKHNRDIPLLRGLQPSNGMWVSGD